MIHEFEQLRVSGLMTNAPYMLNVDCDMYANEADVVRQAMCVFLQKSKSPDRCAFVQFPQEFYDSNSDELAVVQSVGFVLLAFIYIFGQFSVLYRLLINLFLLFFLLKLVFGKRCCRNPRTAILWLRMLPY